MKTVLFCLLIMSVCWQSSFGKTHENAKAVRFHQFVNADFDIVLSLYNDGDSDMYICYAMNAYRDTNAYAINLWRSYHGRNIVDEIGSYLDHYMADSVGSTIKSMSRFEVPCFTPQYDSIASANQVVSFYVVKDMPVCKPALTSKPVIAIPKESRRPTYFAFHIRASGIILEDYRGAYFGYSAPSAGHFNKDDQNIPSILFSKIISCDMLNEAALSRLGIRYDTQTKIKFAYQDH